MGRAGCGYCAHLPTTGCGPFPVCCWGGGTSDPHKLARQHGDQPPEPGPHALARPVCASLSLGPLGRGLLPVARGRKLRDSRTIRVAGPPELRLVQRPEGPARFAFPETNVKRRRVSRACLMSRVCRQAWGGLFPQKPAPSQGLLGPRAAPGLSFHLILQHIRLPPVAGKLVFRSAGCTMKNLPSWVLPCRRARSEALLCREW